MKRTRHVLLGLLQEERLSGYDMKRIIETRMSFFWQESYGQIYPELGKMKEEGLIAICDIEPAGDKKREKTKYVITPKGQMELKKWMEAENEKDTTRSEFLLKMYLSTDKNVEEMRKHIHKFKEQSEKRLGLFNVFEAQLKQNKETHNNHKHILCVLDLGIRQTRLYIDWCTGMLGTLGKEDRDV